MEISWPFSRPDRHQRHRQRPGVATECLRRIDSRRAMEKEQRRGGSTRSCCHHHYRDDDHYDHRRQCGSSSTALARTLSAIAVSLVLLSPTATAAAATTATATAATAATAAIHHASPGSTGDPAVAASPAGHDKAAALTAYETETDPAAASVEVGATRASRKPPPLPHPSDPAPPPGPAQRGSTRSSNRVEEGAIDSSGHENCGASGGRGGSRDCEYDEYYDCVAGGDEATGAAAVPVCCRRPAGEFLAHPVDERDDDRGDFVALAAPAGCGGGSAGGSAGDCGGVGGGEGGGGADGDEVGGDIDDGAVASSPTSGRNVEQAVHNVEHELDSVGHGARTAASASDPSIPGGDAEPPAATAATTAAATADDAELEVDVKQALTPIPTTPLPTEEDAGAGTPQTEALTNREEKEQELNAAAAVNSAAPRARPGESAEVGADVGGSIHREAEGVGGGLETTLAAAPPRQTGGCDLPTTRTTSTDADAVAVPARRGSGRTPLAKTGGCGSKGQSPALGSWVEEQSDEEEGDQPRHGEGEAGQGARLGLVSESGPAKGGALHEEPGRSDGVVSAGSAGGAREDADVGVDPGVDEQRAAGATSAAAAAATLDLEPAQQPDVPEMSPTLHTRTGLHEAEGSRVAGTGTDAEKAAAGVFEGGVGNGGVKGEGGGKQQQQQQTTTGTRRRDKGGWGWSAPGVGGGKEGFGGGGGGGKEPVTWRKAVIALIAGAAIVLSFAQGNLPRWLPLIGGDLRDGWALDLPPPGSRRGSLLSGRGGDGMGGRYDEPPMPDLVWDEEPETAPPLPRVAAKASHGGGDHGGIGDVPLKWDTRPKAPDHLVFHPVLGVVPTGVLDAWKRASRSGRGGVSGGGGGGRGGGVEGGGALPGTEAVGRRGRGGGSGERNESATGASTRRGSNGSRSSSSSQCLAGAPPSFGLKGGEPQPLPPVRYTPEWHAWCAARGEAGDLAEEKSEALPLQGFPLPKASLVAASGDRKVGVGDEAGVVVGVAAVGKVNPQPQKKSTTPAAIGLQREAAAEVSGVDQAEGGGGGGGGGNDGDEHFGENYPDETRDGRSGLLAPASAHPPPMISRVA